MYRNALSKLLKWKAASSRKPLIIRGARQVGKTWLMKEFAASAYESCIYINFENNSLMQELFDQDTNITRIIKGLELAAGQSIDPQNTLIIFDEIQEVPKALTALKYFYEDAPEYQIICAGSLLGIALHPGTSFPVGKVEFLQLYPMTFREFLMAVAEQRFIEMLDIKDFSMITVFKQHYIELLKQYYYVGGMPEAVLAFSQQKSFTETQQIHQRILAAYEQDFSKHAPNSIVPRIRLLWNSIPVQLARESKKFNYGQIKQGARSRDYELALLWLTDCGLIHRISKVQTPGIPLSAYQDLRAFKLFLLDVGLLSSLAGLQPDTLLDGNTMFREFKGALTEQYVCQQLIATDNIETYYWSSDRGSSEIDFLISDGSHIVPLEVKAETNLQAKSLKIYREKFMPELSIRASLADYRNEGWLINLPLYAIDGIGSLISSSLAFGERIHGV